jgi:hypothetical protein
MSLGSPADIISFPRFLACRHRLPRMAVMTGAVVTPPSHDLNCSIRVDRHVERSRFVQFGDRLVDPRASHDSERGDDDGRNVPVTCVGYGSRGV